MSRAQIRAPLSEHTCSVVHCKPARRPRPQLTMQYWRVHVQLLPPLKHHLRLCKFRHFTQHECQTRQVTREWATCGELRLSAREGCGHRIGGVSLMGSISNAPMNLHHQYIGIDPQGKKLLDSFALAACHFACFGARRVGAPNNKTSCQRALQHGGTMKASKTHEQSQEATETSWKTIGLRILIVLGGLVVSLRSHEPAALVHC